MHIPDGFLDVKTCVTTYLAAGGSLAYGLRRLKPQFREEQIPTLGLIGAFIFAAQMINLTIAPGTSGHLLGGALAMLVVGPWAAGVVITSILTIQSVFFMDGGILALGANVLNMAVVGVLVSYAIFRGLARWIPPVAVRTFLAACLSTVTAAALAALELAVSGTRGLALVLPAMLGWHLIIGLVEGVITVLVIGYLMRVVPERLYCMQRQGGDLIAK